MNSQIEIYQSADGQSQVEVRFEQDTIWLNQKQMADLFDKDVRTISEHIQNIYLTGELKSEGTIRNFRIVRQEGKRKVNRQIDHYNLDMIISVGYRVNSRQGTQFRIWATQRLKEYLVQGYAINRQRLEQQQMEIEHLKSGIRIWSRALTQKSEREELDWLTIFAKGLTLLDDYDHENLESRGQNLQPALYPSWDEYQHIIAEMKKEFDSAVFGKEKDRNFRSSIAQIAKGMGEEDFYPSLEEKAAMLLYLITKNHSFVDGNKRIAAACFLLFLDKNQLLFTNSGRPLLSNDALASLTLFIAASKPAEMETVKRLIISVLNRNQF
jgi:prophage maintenance system killer protein